MGISNSDSGSSNSAFAKSGISNSVISNTNVDITFSAHDAFLELSSSGTLYSNSDISNSKSKTQ